MAAFLSSSRLTTPSFSRAASAISTMPTAPSTIIFLASMTADACCRCSITAAISGA